MKMSISMPDELLKKLDDYADENYMTRSGAISMMVNNYLDSREITKNLQAMTDILRNISSGTGTTADEEKALEVMEYLAKFMPVR